MTSTFLNREREALLISFIPFFFLFLSLMLLAVAYFSDFLLLLAVEKFEFIVINIRK